MVGRPHRPCAPKSGQHLIGDEQCVEFVRDLPHGMNEIIGRNDVARRALHRLHDDRRDFVLRLVLDDVAQMIGAGQSAGRILKLPGAAIAVRIRRQMHSGRKRTLMVAVAAAEQTDHACCLAVIAAPETDELEFLRDRLGKTKGRLDGLRTAGKKLDVSDAFREQVTDKLEEAGARFGREAAESGARELLADALHIMGVAVPDAAHRNAGNKVEIFVPIDVVNRAALCAIDRDLRIKGDRLQARRHHLGLAIENRFRSGTRHGAPFGAVFLRRRHVTGRSTFHDSTPCRDTIRTRRSKRSAR